MADPHQQPAADSSYAEWDLSGSQWPSFESTVDKLEGAEVQEPNKARNIFASAEFKLPEPGEPGAAVPLNLGRFKLIGEVGRGRFGIVYRARDDQLDRDVAIKVARPEIAADEEQRNRFGREAELAGRLHHPGIVPVHEVGIEGPWLFIVMGFCDGVTLTVWNENQQDKISPAQAVRLTKQIADAIAHGHSKGVVHRDLKPANIGVILGTGDVNPSDVSIVSGADRVPGDPELRVFDFGLSCGSELHLRDTRTSISIGTPLYMAPEQLRGSNVTAAADVYAIGTILYELLTGVCPFEAPTQPEVLHRLWHEEPESPRVHNPEVNRELEAVCLKALAKRPEDRYADAAELSEDLTRWLRGRPTAARPTTLARRIRLWSERPSRLREAGAVILTQHLVLPVWSVFGQLGPQASLGALEDGELITPQFGATMLVHLLFFFIGYRLWSNRPSVPLMGAGFLIAFCLVPLHLGRGLGWLPTPSPWFDENPDTRWLIFWLMSLTAGIDMIALAVAMRSDRRRRLDKA